MILLRNAEGEDAEGVDSDAELAASLALFGSLRLCNCSGAPCGLRITQKGTRIELYGSEFRLKTEGRST